MRVVAGGTAWRVTPLLAALAVMTACGGGEAAAPRVVASVEVTPATVTVQPAQSSNLTATAREADGTAIVGRSVVWTSSNPAVATVSATGVVTGVTDGVTSVSAAIGSVSGSAAVVVRSAVAAVAVTPTTATVTMGRAPVQLSAAPRNAAGAAITGRTVTWSSSAPTIASVSATGLVAAVAPGSATISATSEGITGTAAITVAPDPCNVVRALPVGQTVNGTFTANDCVLSDTTALQRYSFTLAARTKVEILMSSATLDSYLFLVDSALNVIVEDDDGDSGRNARIMRTLPAGRYEIIANVYEPRTYGTYQLTLRNAPAVCTTGRQTAVPTTLSANLATTACRMNDGSYQDRYDITVATRGLYRVEVASTAFDAVAVVLDQNENVVAQDDDSGTGTDASLEVSLAPGRYTVLATGYPGQTGAYRFTVAQAVDPCGVNRTLTLGQSVINTLATSDCALSDGGGPARYLHRTALSLTTTTSVQIDMTSTAVDSYLILQNAATGAVVAENDDVSSTSRNARILATLPAGTYIINTTTYNTGETGAYQLSATVAPNSTVNVAVTPSVMALVPGQTQSARTTVTGSANTAVIWQSSNTNVATVSTDGVVRALTPGTATISAISQADPRRAGTIAVTVAATDGSVNLDVSGMYVVQSVQQADGRIPLVANRQAVARVFVRSSRLGLGAVQVRLRVIEGGAAIATFNATATPTSTLDESCCSADFPITAAMVKAGVSLLADVDPNNLVSEANETDNVFPTVGTMPLNVVSVPPMAIRLVPVQQSRNGQIGVANNSLFNIFRSIWPFEVINATLRTPLVIDYTIGSQNFDDWIRLVRDVEIVRQAEGGAHYYYGLVRTRGTSGVLGLANGIPARTAIGVDEGSDFGPGESRLTFAHEMGHTMGLRHAPCGGAAGPDPNYPFSDGRIGVYGMDTFGGNAIKGPVVNDIMTYCPNQWVSAYNYRKVMDFRQANPNGVGNLLAPTRALLVSGGISASGITLDPAFSMTTSPAAADARGTHVIEGFDANNRTVFTWRFTPYRVDDARSDQDAFVVAVPMSEATQQKLARLVVREATGSFGSARSAVRTSALAVAADAGSTAAAPVNALAQLRRSGGKTELTWSPAVSPAVMVRNRATGEVVALARTGTLDLTQFGSLAGLDLHVSDGTKSTRLVIDAATGALRR
ncbi:MAG TPA: Ig-like domain-containing protein [Gemmatimonas sp.]